MNTQYEISVIDTEKPKPIKPLIVYHSNIIPTVGDILMIDKDTALTVTQRILGIVNANRIILYGSIIIKYS